MSDSVTRAKIEAMRKKGMSPRGANTELEYCARCGKTVGFDHIPHAHYVEQPIEVVGGTPSDFEKKPF